MENMPVRLDDLIDFVNQQQPQGGPLDRLSGAVLVSQNIGELSDHLIGHFVDQARRGGASWTEIGQAMGVTKQAAQKRFVPRPDAIDVTETGNFSRFTMRARNVVMTSRDEARTAGNDVITTAHLVLGLLHEPEGLAAKALVAQGVSPDALRAAVAAAVAPPAAEIPDHIPFGQDCKTVLNLALRAAFRLGHNYIGTEHILLGILDDPQTPGAQILAGEGATKDSTEPLLLAALAELLEARRQSG
jgi:hypothetical protein